MRPHRPKVKRSGVSATRTRSDPQTEARAETVRIKPREGAQSGRERRGKRVKSRSEANRWAEDPESARKSEQARRRPIDEYIGIYWKKIRSAGSDLQKCDGSSHVLETGSPNRERMAVFEWLGVHLSESSLDRMIKRAENPRTVTRPRAGYGWRIYYSFNGRWMPWGEIQGESLAHETFTKLLTQPYKGGRKWQMLKPISQ